MRGQEKYAEALVISRRELEAKERTLGPENVDTLLTLDWVAYTLRYLDRFTEALELWQRERRIIRQLFRSGRADEPGAQRRSGQSRDAGAVDGE